MNPAADSPGGLPIDEVLPALLAAMAASNAVVLQAPPGAGKTTGVPPALLAAPWLSGRRILMLEPRRLAARAAARFLARRYGEDAGATVGYRTRLDSRVSRLTRIEVVTEGILTRLLQDDPALEAYGVVIFDEFHERSLQADLGLALARECQQALREDLRLLVMSATLEVAPVARLLASGGVPAPVIASEGRAFPVRTDYLPVPARGTSLHAGSAREAWIGHLVRELPDILAADEGSALVFLPGVAEIRRVESALAGRLPANVEVRALYGELGSAMQDAAIAPVVPGRRKVVLATSIAETSLTIEGVRIVVDAGWQRRAVFDPGSAMTRLVTRRVSQAAADQRRGRAGRTGPGRCFRLWPEAESLAAFTPAEIVEADLSGLVLELAQWGARDPAALAWLDAPPKPAWEQGVALLKLLGAINQEAAITAHGRRLLTVGLSPRLAHLVVRGGELGHGRLAAALASLLSERDLLGREAGVDLRARVELLSGDDQGARVDPLRLRAVREAARKLCGPMTPDEAPVSSSTVGELLALAYPDRIARRRAAAGNRYLLANGRGAFLPDGEALAKHEWLVCAELDGEAREAKIFLAAPVNFESLPALLPQDFRREDFVGWDDAAGAFVATGRRWLGAILVDEKPLPPPDADQVRAALLRAIAGRGLDVFDWNDDAKQFRARVMLMHRLEPEHWPDFSDTSLRSSLADWAAPFLDDIRRLSQLRGFPLLAALRAHLGYARERELDRSLPEHWTVPTGSRIAIDYTGESGPLLAVKLQEMFGCTQTPALADGRVPLLLHLLSPARRPVAVTRNLATFWRQAYPDVRKDLRGRYPKHPWPEDPLTASPQRGVTRKK